MPVQDPRWGNHTRAILDGRMWKPPRGGGHDDKAHPPIHPVKSSEGAWRSEHWIHFLCTCIYMPSGLLHVTTSFYKLQAKGFCTALVTNCGGQLWSLPVLSKPAWWRDGYLLVLGFHTFFIESITCHVVGFPLILVSASAAVLSHEATIKYLLPYHLQYIHSGSCRCNQTPPSFLPAGNGNWTDEKRRLYEFIVRSFLACCSKDAVGFETQIIVEIAGVHKLRRGAEC